MNTKDLVESLNEIAVNDLSEGANIVDHPAHMAAIELIGLDVMRAEVARLTDEPIEMVLCCPECGEQHIDRIKPEQGWDNPPHKTHLCDYCDHCWRPCDRPTEGVAKTKTLGKIADEDGAIFKTYKYQFDAIKRLTDECDALREQLKDAKDDHHTMEELYDHRHALFLNLIANSDAMRTPMWKSKRHSDGGMYEDWFIAGMELTGGAISYHMPMRLWDKTNATEIPLAPEWDGYTPQDVVDRLMGELLPIPQDKGSDG